MYVYLAIKQSTFCVKNLPHNHLRKCWKSLGPISPGWNQRSPWSETYHHVPHKKYPINLIFNQIISVCWSFMMLYVQKTTNIHRPSNEIPPKNGNSTRVKHDKTLFLWVLGGLGTKVSFVSPSYPHDSCTSAFAQQLVVTPSKGRPAVFRRVAWWRIMDKLWLMILLDLIFIHCPYYPTPYTVCTFRYCFMFMSLVLLYIYTYVYIYIYPSSFLDEFKAFVWDN